MYGNLSLITSTVNFMQAHIEPFLVEPAIAHMDNQEFGS